MNGTLTLASGDLALHSSAEVTKGGERFLWDDPFTASFAAGRGALASNSALGSLNTAVGSDALSVNTNGALNTAIGARALQYNSIGGGNTASGYGALFNNTTGFANTASGAEALSGNTTGSFNTAIGEDAMTANTTGNFNTAVGRSALTNNTTGSYNTALGRTTLWNNGTGSYNIAVGEKAGYATDGSSNILIGNGGADSESNTLRIGTQGNGLGQQNRAFIAGIYGTTAAGAGQIVVVDDNGQLGTAAAGGVTDDWVNVTGDAMTGLLTLNPTSGFALQTGSGDDIDLGGDLFKSGVRFLHTPGDANTGVGYSALPSVTTGTFNTALGGDALGSNTTGSDNTATGDAALRFNTTGSGNTASGSSALTNNTAGSNNTASGVAALASNSTGNDNTATGGESLRFNTFGNLNTATGHRALFSNITGNFNTATGNLALFENTDGSENTATGYSALRYSTTGDFNTANGSGALYSNTDGNWNVAVGTDALRDNTLGNANTAVGFKALESATDGSSNVAVGEGALANHTIGSYNVALGSDAGVDNIVGASNILIGNPGLTLESNTLRIGTPGTGNGQQDRAFIAGIWDATTIGLGVPVLVDSSGQLGIFSSSRRFKQDIEALEEESDRLLDLHPVKFRYQEDATKGDTTLQYGLIAEEVAAVFPELVVSDEEGEPYTVRYHLLAPLLLAEVQRLDRELRADRDLLAAQRQEIHDLRRRLEGTDPAPGHEP
jgi:hypothetical protein